MPNSCLAKHQAVGVNRRARSLICRISPKPSHSVQIKPSNILLALNTSHILASAHTERSGVLARWISTWPRLMAKQLFNEKVNQR